MVSELNFLRMLRKPGTIDEVRKKQADDLVWTSSFVKVITIPTIGMTYIWFVAPIAEQAIISSLTGIPLEMNFGGDYEPLFIFFLLTFLLGHVVAFIFVSFVVWPFFCLLAWLRIPPKVQHLLPVSAQLYF